MRIAVIDDNREILEMTQRVIRQKVGGLVTMRSYMDSEMLLFDIDEREQFDAFILDIEMPKISGLELAKKIRKLQEKAKIIFLTAHGKFALESYDVDIQADQYILKEEVEEKLPKVLKSLAEELSKKRFYILETPSGFSKIYCDDIIYIYKDGKNAVIVTKNGEERERKTLEKIVKDMNFPELIFVERGYVVNIQHISQVTNNNVKMDNSKEIIISRGKMKSVKQSILDYWGKVL